MTNKPFDPHVIIRKLAEAELECADCGGTGTKYWGVGGMEEPDISPCDVCDGTSHRVPFASLKVNCVHCNGTGYDYQPVQPYGSEQIDCHWCEGIGWVPEPDVRVACWEVSKWLRTQGQFRKRNGYWWFDQNFGTLSVCPDNASAEEATLCTAEILLAWSNNEREAP